MLRAMVVGPRADCFDPTVSGGALLDGGIERHGHRTACGKSCAVTSAARGIGRGIAIRLAAAGAHVAVVDLDVDGAQQVVDEMGEAMLRTSFSQILNSSRDFSTAITDAGGRLVAQAEYIPVHVGAMPASVLATLEACGDDIHPGDVFLLHDPYFGRSQLPDLTACLPVFVGERLLCWALNRAHYSDHRWRDPRCVPRVGHRDLAGGAAGVAPIEETIRIAAGSVLSGPAGGVVGGLTAHPREAGPTRLAAGVRSRAPASGVRGTAVWPIRPQRA